MAREVEERVKAIEGRVRVAAGAVQTITAAQAGGSRTAEPLETPPEPAPRAESRPEPAPEDMGPKIDINRVSFEQLRELGLTVTQAARLLASRDARGRYRSLDEINDLWGFSRDLIDSLMRRLSISGD
jgi:DNA uptake protein ComE-like DNA-binding protein